MFVLGILDKYVEEIGNFCTNTREIRSYYQTQAASDTVQNWSISPKVIRSYVKILHFYVIDLETIKAQI